MRKSFVLNAIHREWMRTYIRPRLGMSERQIDQVSAHNWAVGEILKKLQEEPRLYWDVDLDYKIVEDFMEKMDEYACMSRQKSHWFSAAKDAAEWVLDIIISTTH